MRCQGLRLSVYEMGNRRLEGVSPALCLPSLRLGALFPHGRYVLLRGGLNAGGSCCAEPKGRALTHLYAPVRVLDETPWDKEWRFT
jgi:hypothetical protein